MSAKRAPPQPPSKAPKAEGKARPPKSPKVAASPSRVKAGGAFGLGTHAARQDHVLDQLVERERAELEALPAW